MRPESNVKVKVTQNGMHHSANSRGILQTRSEVKVKLTLKWYVTLHHSKLHPHTKFGIPTLNNIEICSGQSRSEVKVTVTHKWNTPLHHSKMHPHTKFGIPFSNNIRDMLQTQ